MSIQGGIRNRRKRRKINKAFELQLTSMMDVLVIIVVFLLKSYNTSTNNFTMSPGMKLPYSTSQESPTDSLQIVVTPEFLSVDNERVLDLSQTSGSVGGPGSSDVNYTFKNSDLDEGGRRIIALYDALMKAKERTELLLAKSKSRMNGKPIPFEGIVAVQADKRIKYDTIRKIMYTAAAAGYKNFRFLAMKRES